MNTRIIIKDLEGKLHEVELDCCSLFEAVKYVKDLRIKLTGLKLDLENIEFSFNGRLLAEDMALNNIKDYSIEKEIKLGMVKKGSLEKKYWRIKMRTMSGVVHSVYVLPTTKLDVLWEAAQEFTSINKIRQRVVFQGALLKRGGGNIISDIKGLVHESQIHVIIQLKGD